MSRGINRKAKDARYYRAVGRQQLLCDVGTYRFALQDNGTVVGYATLPAAPAVQFMREVDREVPRPPDYREWAREAWRSRIRRPVFKTRT